MLLVGRSAVINGLVASNHVRMPILAPLVWSVTAVAGILWLGPELRGAPWPLCLAAVVGVFTISLVPLALVAAGARWVGSNLDRRPRASDRDRHVPVTPCSVSLPSGSVTDELGKTREENRSAARALQP